MNRRIVLTICAALCMVSLDGAEPTVRKKAKKKVRAIEQPAKVQREVRVVQTAPEDLPADSPEMQGNNPILQPDSVEPTTTTPTTGTQNLDLKPVQYNIELPTGFQQQPIYYTKDLTFGIGSTQLGFYGFVKADYLGESKVVGNVGDIVPASVPLDSDLVGSNMQSIIDARTSRLGFKIEDTANGMIMKGAIEGDFATTDGTAINTNSRHYRLRLAYAAAETPGHVFILAGQYYGLQDHYPEIDMPTRVNILHYPPAVNDCRYPQFRVGYKQYFDDVRLMQYEINAENLGYTNVGIISQGGDASTSQAAFQKWPLANARAMYLGQYFRASLTGSATRAYAIADMNGDRIDRFVWGATATASWTWKDLMLWGTAHHYVGLTGISQNYLNQLTIVGSTAAPRLDALTTNAWCAAFRYDIVPKKFWIDAMYGVERGREITGSQAATATFGNPTFTGSSIQKVEDFRVNAVAAFWKHWQFGLEYERSQVRAYNGQTGVDNMVHMALWYIFGQP